LAEGRPFSKEGTLCRACFAKQIKLAQLYIRNIPNHVKDSEEQIPKNYNLPLL
jgi:hypothetical protein